MYVVYVAYARYICIHLRCRRFLCVCECVCVEIAHTPRFVFDFADCAQPECRLPNQFALHICIISSGSPQLFIGLGHTARSLFVTQPVT